MSTQKQLIEYAKKQNECVKNYFTTLSYNDALTKLRECHNQYNSLEELYEHKKNTPVTKEILEKNGFEFNMPFQATYWLTDRSRIEFWFYANGHKGIDVVLNGEGRIFNVYKSELTVADLEDALELCGIDKELDAGCNISLQDRRRGCRGAEYENLIRQ